jgi:asparagine synthetase B (glutamine-hydrolysing)
MFLNELFNNNFHTAIMHCRASTKGSSQENKNNHPIIRGNIIGVHNGTIDDDIINIYRTITEMGPVAGSEVDSALIFEMLNRVDNISDIIFVLNRFINYAVAFIDIKNDALFVARDISDKRKIYYFNNEDLFIFAQEEMILRNAIKDSEYIRRCYKVTCEKDVFDKIKPFELPNNNIVCVKDGKTKIIKTRDYDGNILSHLSSLLLKHEKTIDVLKKLDADGLIDPTESSICDVLKIKKNVVQEHSKNLIVEPNNDSPVMGSEDAQKPFCMEMF